MYGALSGLVRMLFACTLVCACGRIRFEATDDASGDGSFGDGSDAAFDPSLLLWYPMDDETADGAQDASGYGRDAACGSNGCPTGSGGRVGGAFAFMPNRYLRLASTSAFESLTAFTVTLWLRVTVVSPAGYSGIGKTVGSTVENSWDVGTWSGNLPSFCTSGDGNSNSCDLSPTMAPVGTWFHLAGTWDGTNKRIYFNGVGTTFSPRSVIFDTHDITIGCDDENGSLFACLDGAIDDVRIYSRALSDAEIVDLANPP